MPRRIALLIGNGAFPREPELAALAGPANDVRHLAEVLGSPALGAFDEVKTFVDAEHHAIAPEVEETLAEAAADATVLIYYSGHGKLNSRGQLCLATVNTRLSQLHSTSLPLPTLKTLIDESRCRQVLLILDCCFSGAAGKAFLRGTVDDQLLLSAQESSGLHILSSSTGLEVSRERENEAGGEVMGNFTRCLVEGIRTGDADANGDGVITVSELREYVGRNLRGQSPRYWGIEAGGDPPVARNANSLRERQARERREREEAERRRVAAAQKRLTAWLNAGQLPADAYARALDCLEPPEEGEAPPPLARDRLLELIEGPAANPRHLATALRALDAADGDPAPAGDRREERRPPTGPAPPAGGAPRESTLGRSTAGGSTAGGSKTSPPPAGASTAGRTADEGADAGELPPGRSTFATWQTSGSRSEGAKTGGSGAGGSGADRSTAGGSNVPPRRDAPREAGKGAPKPGARDIDSRPEKKFETAVLSILAVMVTVIVIGILLQKLGGGSYEAGDATTEDTTTVAGWDTGIVTTAPMPVDTGVAYPLDTTAMSADTTAGYWYGDTMAADSTAM